MTVVILHDELPTGASADRLDVLAQVQAVSGALVELGHVPITAAFSLDLKGAAELLARLSPDLVFNLVESVEGHGRLIYLAPALLDALRIPYTGAGTEAMFLSSHKMLTKERLRGHGIATPDWYSLKRLRRSGQVTRGRYIIKSVWEEASVGLDEDSVIEAEDADVLQKEIESRLDSLGGDGFAEAYIDGREFTISLLASGHGPEVLPPAEICFDGYGRDKLKVVGYRAKWDPDSFEYHHTTRRFDFPASDARLLNELTMIARGCWRLLGLRGYARVDFRVDGSGRPWVLEVNANPCLSPDAGFAAAPERAGFSFAQAIVRIIADVETSPAGKAVLEPVLSGTGG